MHALTQQLCDVYLHPVVISRGILQPILQGLLSEQITVILDEMCRQIATDKAYKCIPLDIDGTMVLLGGANNDKSGRTARRITMDHVRETRRRLNKIGVDLSITEADALITQYEDEGKVSLQVGLSSDIAIAVSKNRHGQRVSTKRKKTPRRRLEASMTKNVHSHAHSKVLPKAPTCELEIPLTAEDLKSGLDRFQSSEGSFHIRRWFIEKLPIKFSLEPVKIHDHETNTTLIVGQAENGFDIFYNETTQYAKHRVSTEAIITFSEEGFKFNHRDGISEEECNEIGAKAHRLSMSVIGSMLHFEDGVEHNDDVE